MMGLPTQLAVNAAGIDRLAPVVSGTILDQGDQAGMGYALGRS